VQSSPDNLLSHIPDPATVRARLTQNAREAELLKRLLRLAEERAKFQAVDAEARTQAVPA
jgi:hypothetical protein